MPTRLPRARRGYSPTSPWPAAPGGPVPPRFGEGSGVPLSLAEPVLNPATSSGETLPEGKGARGFGGDLLRPALLAAVLAETVLLRLALRLGQALPPDERLGHLFSALAILGITAQNFAVILGTVLLGELALRRAGQPDLRRRVSGVLLATAGLGGAVHAFGLLPPGFVLGNMLVTLAAMISVPVAARPLPGSASWRAWLALALVAYAALSYHYASQTASSLGWSLPWTAPAYFVAEGVAVVAALSLLPLFRPRWHRSWAVVSALLPIALVAALWVRPWTVASLSVWTFGFTLFLPSPFYGLALWSVLFTIASLARGTAADRRLALGLSFIVLAGLKLDYSYFHLLALLGVCFVAGLEYDGSGWGASRATVRPEPCSG